MSSAFEVQRTESIDEIKSEARIYKHVKSGARILSLKNHDENKVFGITFKTPRNDSTGIAHILEHAVLCGSEAYPAKEPFVELLKASLKTFLNAFTYPDKTCYPVASTNEQDFFNLTRVYLDAVLFPKISEDIFKQEGWHYELDNPEAPLTYKGVVYNEMKGSLSDPLTRLYHAVKAALFPDVMYRFNSGGDPAEILNLTYQQFKLFHQEHYHPANSFIFVYGDIEESKRLALLDEYLSRFDSSTLKIEVELQPLKELSFTTAVHTYDPGDDETDAGSITAAGWLFPELTDPLAVLELSMLNYILNGSSAAPLYKALIDSGLGDTIVGGGIHTELRQSYYSIGLKGIKEEDAGAVKEIILSTLTSLCRDGIDQDLIDAALNTIEFSLRENNTGGYPRGLVCMLRALGTWIYDGDPLSMLAYEEPLQQLKDKLETREQLFEPLLKKYFLSNSHSAQILLIPEKGKADAERKKEVAKLSACKQNFSEAELQEIVDETRRLKAFQEAPDDPEDLAKIPVLHVSDLDRSSREIPTVTETEGDITFLMHPLETSGVVYLDLAFPLRRVPERLLPLLPLFSRALFEMGTETEDFVTLSRRIDRETGGINAGPWLSTARDGMGAAAYFMIRGKATASKTDRLLQLITDVVHGLSLNDRSRFKQLVRQRKAGIESSIVPSGNRYAAMRLGAMYNEAGWVSEQLRGVSQLKYLRELEIRLETDWDSVLADLIFLKNQLFSKEHLLINVTTESEDWSSVRKALNLLTSRLEEDSKPLHFWNPPLKQVNEAFIIPAAVHYVGKTMRLYDHGYSYHGSISVINNILNAGWFWDRVRVQGGAYGGFGGFNRFSGLFTCLSYRDPNLSNTLGIYDRTGSWLKESSFSRKEIERAIIGAIGSLDAYQLPDARGHTAFIREILGITFEERQRIRDEMFATSEAHFHGAGEIISGMKDHGVSCVFGPRETIVKEKSNFDSIESLF